MADIKFLDLLSKDYPNIQAASAEIINLRAISALPKGTEYFLSDLHGEHEAFIHMLKSASGTIKAKIDEHYDGILSERDREDLASLIYNADAEIKRRKKSDENFDDWCKIVIYRLITICQSVSTKYTSLVDTTNMFLGLISPRMMLRSFRYLIFSSIVMESSTKSRFFQFFG